MHRLRRPRTPGWRVGVEEHVAARHCSVDGARHRPRGVGGHAVPGVYKAPRAVVHVRVAAAGAHLLDDDEPVNGSACSMPRTSKRERCVHMQHVLRTYGDPVGRSRLGHSCRTAVKNTYGPFTQPGSLLSLTICRTGPYFPMPPCLLVRAVRDTGLRGNVQVGAGRGCRLVERVRVWQVPTQTPRKNKVC